MRFVIGDIHGQYGALKDCLTRIKFDYNNDNLISLGDLVDRGNYSFEVVQELLKIQHLILIRGNHDAGFLGWIESGKYDWWQSYCSPTLTSYQINLNLSEYPLPKEIPQSHIVLLKNAKCLVQIDDFVFVHGGFDPSKPVKNQNEELFYWNRDLANTCAENKPVSLMTGISKIFIGHTPTIQFGKSKPMFSQDIVNMDTGAGYPQGKLTIMNLDTFQYYQSKLINQYPEFKHNAFTE